MITSTSLKALMEKAKKGWGAVPTRCVLPTISLTLSLSHFHFHTSTFTLSLSHFHFHTFTLSLSHFHTFTLSHFHTFTFTLLLPHFHFHTITFTPGCDEYSDIRIFPDTNIRPYHICFIFLIQIYLDIRSYCFFDTNIFAYSFVSFF